MAPAKLNDTVKVHYTGKLNDGTIFDSSIEREPLEFKLGEGRVIPGFEEAVTGMSQGEAKTVTIPAEEAYGPYRDDLIMSVDPGQFPSHIEPHIGQQLQVQQQGGQTMIVKVTEVAADHVKLDANHPLAGQDLTFDIQLMEIA
jgi:peptidylprolyl isomerase